ncbi:MAG TPA: GNAT family N-acetyltransferase, partial [Ktedonobacterales bacterium]
MADMESEGADADQAEQMEQAIQAMQAMQALADTTYRRDLGDGLLLRWSTPADTERLATFYGLVFRRKELDPPYERVMAWTRDLMSGRDPLIGQDGFALVENIATGEVVAATCLLSEAWEYDGIRIPLGRPEIVGSLPDYRRRGLVREVMQLIHARSQTQGDLAQVITGIPWYYRQFGYEYALEMEYGVRIALADIPAAKDNAPEQFTLRPASEDDLSVVARLYDEERAGALVSTPIDARYWRWAVVECDPAGDSFARVYVVLDTSGAVAGYALTGVRRTWEGEYDIYALWLRPGAWRGALPATLRALRRIGEEAPEAPSGGANVCRALRLYLPPAHPALAALPALVHAQPLADHYAWYVRVANLPALLRTLAPTLERRLAASPFAGYTGNLTLDFYRGGLRMAWREGKLATVADWRKP